MELMTWRQSSRDSGSPGALPVSPWLEGIWLQVPENSIYTDLKIRDLSFLPNEFGGKRLLMRVRDPMIRAPLSDKEAPARK